MNIKKFFLLINILLINILFGDNYSNNINYLFEKYKIRKTIETLEALKKLYPENSEKYIVLQKAENYFMKNLPIDAYSTYVRIKLGNVIDNSIENRKKMEDYYNRTSRFLNPNTNLDLIYKRKQEIIKNQQTQNQLNQQNLGQINPNILNPAFRNENIPLENLPPSMRKSLKEQSQIFKINPIKK